MLTERIIRLNDKVRNTEPTIDLDRARLITEFYSQPSMENYVLRRAKAFKYFLENKKIFIDPDSQIAGHAGGRIQAVPLHPDVTKWLYDDFDTLDKRVSDHLHFRNEEEKEELRQIVEKWHGHTFGDFAADLEEPDVKDMLDALVFTHGVSNQSTMNHTPDYDNMVKRGYRWYIDQCKEKLANHVCKDVYDMEQRINWEAMIIAMEAIISFAHRYADLAEKQAAECTDPKRKEELLTMAENCRRVPEFAPETFLQAVQLVWFTHLAIVLEAVGGDHCLGRFDQYMYPYYKKDIESGAITRTAAQELLDCIWVKLNDLNKVRDAASAEGFAGYSLFQNLIAGGQNEDGIDVTNDLSFMCITSSMHVFLPMPSLSVRVWNGSPHEFLIYAAELTRTGIGLPAYYNDEVIIPSLESRGLTLQDARDYNIIGCVEPQKAGKTNGWHDAAFFNMCRPLELVFSNGVDKGVQIGPKTGNVEDMKTFDEFYDAYKAQMDYAIALLVNADNAIDMAHAERAPLPFLACMVDDCIKRGKTLEQGGAVYNFTGPQGFGVANMADALYAVKKLVYDENKITMHDLKMALSTNYGKGLSNEDVAEMVSEVASAMKSAGQPVGEKEVAAILKTVVAATESEQVKANGERILKLIDAVPKFGNDIPEVDAFARDVAYTYTKPLEKYKNPRGGMFQAGLYPVSANVPLGGQTGATPDGRLAHMPVADGVSPSAGKDVSGPTAAANSVSRLDHYIASNGTLFNQKFHPSALSGREGLEKFVGLIQSYFDQKGSHMQFNVVSRETLLDAQKHPEQYKHLVVRVAGYSALFTTLSKSLQDDIIRRTEQGF